MSRHEGRRQRRPRDRVQTWSSSRALLFLVTALWLSAFAGPARAADRPPISIALGMGASFDRTGLSPERTVAVPSFFAVGGFGQRFVGLDFGLFATTASGRFRSPDLPVDRLGVDVMAVVRPWAQLPVDDSATYAQLVRRSIAGEIGFGYERDTRGLLSGGRTGLRLGARFELPVPGAAATPLRLRLAVRRFVGFYAPKLEDTTVKDTGLEVYAAVALLF